MFHLTPFIQFTSSLPPLPLKKEPAAYKEKDKNKGTEGTLKWARDHVVCECTYTEKKIFQHYLRCLCPAILHFLKKGNNTLKNIRFFDSGTRQIFSVLKLEFSDQPVFGHGTLYSSDNHNPLSEEWGVQKKYCSHTGGKLKCTVTSVLRDGNYGPSKCRFELGHERTIIILLFTWFAGLGLLVRDEKNRELK